MKPFRALHGLPRFVGPCARLNGSRIAPHRYVATAASTAAADSTLPLAGIRVLDMTRVLAGVC